MISIVTAEDQLQYQLLHTRSAAGDGGQTRYAAAMYFYNRGMIDDKVLEIYRGLAKDPSADPDKALKAAQCDHHIELKPSEIQT